MYSEKEKRKKKNQCTVWCLAPGLYIGGALQVFAEWMTKSEGNYPSRKINGYFWYCYNYHLIGQVSGHWFKKLKLCCFISLSSMGKLKKACFKLIAIPPNDLDKILEMGSSGEGKVKYEVKCCDWRISIQAFLLINLDLNYLFFDKNLNQRSVCWWWGVNIEISTLELIKGNHPSVFLSRMM